MSRALMYSLQRRKTVCFLAVVSLIVTITLFGIRVTSAQSPIAIGEITGYAWSDTIGWISFNCSDEGVCGTANYKIEIFDDDTIAGYAWSDTIGWIQFGGLSGCPAGSCDARINGSDELEGWARALSYGGGWDGWVSLNCTNDDSCGTSAYAWDVSGSPVTGFAWGGAVVGWVEAAMEIDMVAECSNGIDDDGDGLIDYGSDNGCINVNDDTEAGQCQDGINNDGAEDSLIDDEDPGCWTDPLDSNTYDETDLSEIDPVIACSDPVLEAHPAIVRAGEEVTISWENFDDTNECRLYQEGLEIDARGPDAGCGASDSPLVTLENVTQFRVECDSWPDDVTITVPVTPNYDNN